MAQANADLWLSFAQDYRDETGSKVHTPEQMGDTMAFLNSEAACGISGITLLVDYRPHHGVDDRFLRAGQDDHRPDHGEGQALTYRATVEGMARVIVIGGHGKVALQLARILTGRGDEVSSVFRNPEHAADVDRQRHPYRSSPTSNGSTRTRWPLCWPGTTPSSSPRGPAAATRRAPTPSTGMPRSG